MSKTENINELREQLAEAEAEVKNLQKELMETNSGIIALYSDLNTANQQLHEKNKELEKTLRELQETQNKLVKSEKMAALGSVVVTYNHHINNPLMIILGNVQLLLMRNENLSGNTKKSLLVIEEECKRISDVMHKIKEYEKLIPVKYLENMYDITKEQGE